MGRDLGLYRVRAEMDAGTIEDEWETVHPVTGVMSWDTEPDLFDTMIYLWTEGNYACDCNRRLFLMRSRGEIPDTEYEKTPCGETISLLRLTAIRPDGTEIVLFGEVPGGPRG